MEELPHSNVQTILSVMRTDPNAISCLLCLQWLGDLEESNHEQKCFQKDLQYFLELDGLECLVTAMAHNPNDPNVLCICCQALCTLTTALDRTLIGLLVESSSEDALEVIVKAMHRYPDEVDLQTVACHFFARLVSPSDDSDSDEQDPYGIHADLVAAGAIESVAQAMKMNPDMIELQMDACQMLQALASFGLYQDRLLQTKNGLLDAVGEAMTTHATNVLLQEYGCAVIRHVAYHTQKRRDAHAKVDATQTLFQAGTLSAVSSALDRHGTAHAAVRKWGCEALCYLAMLLPVVTAFDPSSTLSDKYFTANGMTSQVSGLTTSMIRLMESFPQNSLVQECGCSILHLVASNFPDLQPEIVAAGGERVLRAARRKKSSRHDSVQEQALEALRLLLNDDTLEDDLDGEARPDEEQQLESLL